MVDIVRYMTERELDEFQDIVLDTPGCPGAESFPLAGNYEIHPRKDDFPQSVQDWLEAHGFRRAVDTQRGPFYFRAAPSITLLQAAEQLGVESSTLRRQANAGKLDALKNESGNWVTTQYAIDQYRRDYLGKDGRQPANE